MDQMQFFAIEEAKNLKILSIDFSNVIQDGPPGTRAIYCGNTKINKNLKNLTNTKIDEDNSANNFHNCGIII